MHVVLMLHPTSMIAYKLDMYGIVSYSMGQLLVYGLCWSYPCHHGNFYEHYCKDILTKGLLNE